MKHIVSRYTGVFTRIAVIAFPLALAPFAATAGPLDFTSLVQQDSNICTGATTHACVHITSAVINGNTIDIQEDLAHIYGTSYTASVTFSVGTASGSLLGNTVLGCNYFMPSGTTCATGGNYFDGSAWGGTPGTGTVKVVSDPAVEFYHGVDLYQTADFTGTSLTITWGWLPVDWAFNKTTTYDYTTGFGYTFTNQELSGAPEPGTIALFSSSLVGLIFLGRSRRRR